MKQFVSIFFVMVFFASGQCLTAPNPYAGIKTGINYGTLDWGNDADNWTGMGFQIGLGFGIDLTNSVGVEVAPAFRTTDYSTTVLNTPIGARFLNLWLPAHFLLKAGMIPNITPFIGLGLADNIQLDGTGFIGELESDVEDLENDVYVGFIFGLDVKFVKMKISPEFSFDYNLTANDEDTSNSEKVYDIHAQVGIFYAP